MTEVYNIKLKPYTLIVRTTEKCNVGCDHCSISATKKGNDIPFELAVNAIADAKKLGINRVHFTGGEPLLYENLPQLIEFANNKEMSSDITTSTFTRKYEDTLPILEKLNDKGLECIMLSYDQPHSKSVSIEKFSEFVKESQAKNMHICVFVTEGAYNTFKTSHLKEYFIENGIDIDTIEWSVSEYQFEGRGEKFLPLVEENEVEHYCRCPYLMAVPTLNPDGNVLLCHMARFKTPNFIVGKYPDERMEDILHKMENSSIYRYIAKYGPQQSLRNLGFSRTETPNDMCRACEKYLTIMEQSEFQTKLESQIDNDDLSNIPVDIKAVLPIYQRYLIKNGERL